MKNLKTNQNRIAIFGYLILMTSLSAPTTSGNQGESTICNLHKYANESQLGFPANRLIELSDLIYLFEDVKNQANVNRKISELGFTPRANGIYISKALDRNRRPVNIITIISIGSYTTLSLKISGLSQFSHLVDYISANYRPENANRSVFDELEMRFLGSKYIYDVFVPFNGVNTTKNDYYEIILSRQ